MYINLYKFIDSKLYFNILVNDQCTCKKINKNFK